MNRRESMFAALALGAPFAGWAQPVKERIYNVGFLSPTPTPAPGTPSPLVSALNALGYAEGRNLHVTSRYADGKNERLAALAEELVALKVDVIVAAANVGAAAAQKATRSISIVFLGANAPVEAGLVPSLARPGGNITGVAFDAGADVLGKRMEILKATLPGLRKVGLLAVGSRTPLEPETRFILENWRKEGERAGRALGLSVRQFDLPSVWTDRAQWRELFRRAAAERAGAVVIFDSPNVFANRDLLTEAAFEHRIPSLFGGARMAEAGGLMAYGTNVADIYRLVAGYVDRILKGAKPADLPVELPSKYEFVVNLKTAKLLGIKVPQSVLLRADRVIE